jgi:hypothetical protein
VSLAHAISLAKLQEEKLLDRRYSGTKPSASTSPTAPPPSNSFRPTLTVSPPKKPNLPIKRLTPAELQARREKNLCYNCDDQYVPGHRCKQTFHLLIVGEDPEPDRSLDLLLT